MSVRRTKNQPKRRKDVWFWIGCVAALAVIAGLLLWITTREQRPAGPPVAEAARESDAEKADAALFATYGTSPTCKSCHEEEFADWEHSHHALAERLIDPALDAIAFEPHYRIRHGSQTSEARARDGQYEIVTQGPDGQQTAFPVERVLAVDPLRQFLIAAPGGRLQATELAFDPNHPDWFNVYGEEDRRAGEWGHWTGRGMNWNSMCATCHNTRVRKNYLPETDSYATRMAERGVGCEACHGPMADHNEWQAKHPNQSGDPTIRRITREEMASVCAQCHSRRAELTGDFRPTENFFDHHSLTIPDETDLFYADGQVRDEDFEYTAFLGSKMHAAGVRCIDCHQPHSAKLRISGNYMCLVCHYGPITDAMKEGGQPIGPRIDPETHSHHRVGERGDFCTDCHMPQTVYMQRHARHDHGFTSPDPRLTKEFGIPNACNRCHTERSADWSLDYIVQWYGPRTNDTVFRRAEAVTRARAGDAAAVPGLLKMAREETIPLWRAVAVNLLRRWSAQPEVAEVLRSSAGDTNELVRSVAVRALEPLASSGETAARALVNAGLNDPVRAVRVEAAWALHSSVDTNSTAGRDLLNYLHYNSDQPSGSLQLGVFHLERGEVGKAMNYFQRAVKWDTNSAPLHHALAVALSIEGKTEAAVQSLRTACALAPEDAEYRFKLGLALNEAGRLKEARAALAEAVKLDPQYAQAWYNLGLAHNALGDTAAALEALLRAESIDGRSAQIPYARATILARLGRTEEARAAARRALELQPGHGDAAGLLRVLSR